MRRLISFFLVLLVPYAYYFFTVSWGNLFNSSGSFFAIPDSLAAPAGFITIFGFLLALWKSKKPSKNLLNAAAITAHILLWIAAFPIVFTYDRGLITYAIACLGAILAYVSIKGILLQKAKFLLVISLVVIALIGTLSYKDSYCWRKMLMYETIHQKELAERPSADSPWQWDYMARCKLNFNFIDSIIEK
ncbi:hypothetical protein KBC70_04750 [Candidatus Woesebacteria bacterium]|nr:hypothetical protein [Candidatus Woesebacteria bacterium]